MIEKDTEGQDINEADAIKQIEAEQAEKKQQHGGDNFEPQACVQEEEPQEEVKLTKQQLKRMKKKQNQAANQEAWGMKSTINKISGNFR